MKACKICRLIFEDTPKCPQCNSEELTDKFNSAVYVFDPAKSKIGEKMGVKTPGKYAVRVGK